MASSTVSSPSLLLRRLSSSTGEFHVGESVAVIFQSLCQFFSNVDPAGLLNLPSSAPNSSSSASNNNDEDAFEESCNGVLGVMETMLSVAYKQAVGVISTGRSDRDVVAFNNLLSSLQISLLSWCHQQILASTKNRRAAVFSVVKTYTQMMINKAVALCKDVLEMSSDSSSTASTDFATQEDIVSSTDAPEECQKKKEASLVSKNQNSTLASLVEPLESSFMASTLR